MALPSFCSVFNPNITSEESKLDERKTPYMMKENHAKAISNLCPPGAVEENNFGHKLSKF